MQYNGIIILFIIDYVGINKVPVILKSNSGMKRYAGRGDVRRLSLHSAVTQFQFITFLVAPPTKSASPAEFNPQGGAYVHVSRTGFKVPSFAKALDVRAGIGCQGACLEVLLRFYRSGSGSFSGQRKTL